MLIVSVNKFLHANIIPSNTFFIEFSKKIILKFFFYILYTKTIAINDTQIYWDKVEL